MEKKRTPNHHLVSKCDHDDDEMLPTIGTSSMNSGLISSKRLSTGDNKMLATPSIAPDVNSYYMLKSLKPRVIGPRDGVPMGRSLEIIQAGAMTAPLCFLKRLDQPTTTNTIFQLVRRSSHRMPSISFQIRNPNASRCVMS